MLSVSKILGKETGGIPRGLTTLSVSWFNNQFKAMAVHHGQVGKTWETTGAYESPDQLYQLIEGAIRQTEYQGQTVSLALAHPRMVQQMVDVPPVKGAAVQKVIHRQALQQKVFQGEAAYASQFLATVPGKTGSQVLLHLFPRLLLNQFSTACKRNDLHLASVLPASVVLQRQLAALSLQKADTVVIAAETGGSTTVIAADGDGRLLLARTLQASWNDDLNRLGTDLNRTLLFVTQQFKVSLNRGVYLFGEGAAGKSALLQRLVQFPIHISPVEHEPYYWVQEALKVRVDNAPNFLSHEIQTAPQRRIFATVTAAAAVLLLLGSIALTVYSFNQSRREHATIAALSAQAREADDRIAALQKIDAELKRKQQAINLVLGDRPAPKPAWLLAYLGQVVPADIVITNFNVRREEDYYRVNLAGTAQEAVKSPGATPIAEAVERLKSQLAGSPFNMRILETNDFSAAAIAAASGKPADPNAKTGLTARVPLSEWLNKVTTTVAAAARTEKPEPKTEIKNFNIEGVLK